MVCIYCNNETRVVNSRPQIKSNAVWRRRKCQTCNNIFTTIEEINLSDQIMVWSDSNKSLDHFDRLKFLISIYESCRHRNTPTSDTEALTQTIINEIMKNTVDGTITRNHITTIAHKILERFDQAAAVYYQAYYMKSES